MICPDCGDWYKSLGGGLIHGLCAFCSERLYKKAARRGFPMLVHEGKEPPEHLRERLLDGRRIWWWRNQWRIGKD